METKQTWSPRVFWLSPGVIGLTPDAYFGAPGRILGLVGVMSDATDGFLLRTTAAALVAFLPLL